MPRGLTADFMRELEGGMLSGILAAVRADDTLCLEIRENYINIYYRGGNIMRIDQSAWRYKAAFDRKYLDGNSTSVPTLPDVLSLAGDVDAWLAAIPQLKHAMDLWFGRHSKHEREFQQLMVRENNTGNSAGGTDYFICDIEYANCTGRFDLIAAKWPSTPAARKNNEKLRLAFIEMKYLDDALAGNAGLCSHIEDINRFLGSDDHLQGLKDEMMQIFNQKHRLGLIDNSKAIAGFSDEKPELILALANHDPGSAILRNCLAALPECPNAEIMIATSSFLGYGLYSQGIYSLEEFLARFAGRI